MERRNVRKFSLIILSIFALTCFSFWYKAFNQKAFAFDDEVFYPLSKIEYTDLSEPVDAFIDDKTAVILQSDSSLLISNGDEFTKMDDFLSLNQVTAFDDEKLLISASGSVYLLDRDTLSYQDLKPTNADAIKVGGSNFDINSNYLVTTYGSNIIIYKLQQNYSVTFISQIDGVKNNSPIAINNDNTVFYVKGSSVYSLDLDTIDFNATHKLNEQITKNEKMIINNVSPIKMIANDKELFYISDNKISRMRFGEQSKELTFKQNADYDLGNIESPISIKFKGENLLITDSAINAVQEFNISEDGVLDFTGYAIAKDKTAYNRVLNDKSKIQRLNNEIYVLDSHKLTVIHDIDKFNSYDSKNFTNYLLKDLGEVNNFATGNYSILLSFADGSVKLLDKNSGKLTDDNIEISNVKDVTFKNGKYYILSTNETKSTVYVSDESIIERVSSNPNGNKFEKKVIIEFSELLTNLPLAKKITVDEDCNVYTLTNSNVYKNNKVFASNDGISDFGTDLFNNVYSTKGKNIRYYSLAEKDWKNLDINATTNFVSFSMGIDYSDVYYLLEGNEFIYKTDNLLNASISNLTITSGEEYIVTDSTAKIDIKCVTADEKANIYAIEHSNGAFSFTNNATKEKEYIYICALEYQGVNGKKQFNVCAGENGITLIDDSKLSEKLLNDFVTYEAPKTAYVTTNVNGYYIPIITRNCEYALTNNQQNIRLTKGLSFSYYASFSVLGVDFYLASLQSGEKDVLAYIPVSFTVPVLSQHMVYQTYSLEKTNKTTLYKNSNLSDEIMILEENTEVRVINADDKVSEVLVKTGDGFIKGYISSTDIVNAPNRAIRNLLLLLAVITCVSGTVTYFLLRRKNV